MPKTRDVLVLLAWLAGLLAAGRGPPGDHRAGARGGHPDGRAGHGGRGRCSRGRVARPRLAGPRSGPDARRAGGGGVGTDASPRCPRQAGTCVRDPDRPLRPDPDARRRPLEPSRGSSRAGQWLGRHRRGDSHGRVGRDVGRRGHGTLHGRRTTGRTGRPVALAVARPTGSARRRDGASYRLARRPPRTRARAHQRRRTASEPATRCGASRPPAFRGRPPTARSPWPGRAGGMPTGPSSGPTRD